MNRAQIRQEARLTRLSSEQMKRQIVQEAAMLAENRLQKKEAEYQEEEDRRTITLYACSILALHNVFGFGQTRCARYMAEIDRLMGELIEGNMTYGSLCRRIDDTLGIVIDPERSKE